jgi:transketolase C-terminal domain/subunit
MLAKEGIDAEVIDPRTIVPLDDEARSESVRKTSRAIVIDEGHQSYGVTAEIASAAQRKGVLPSRCAGSAHGRDGRAGAVQPGAGGHDRADARGAWPRTRASSARGADPCRMT